MRYRFLLLVGTLTAAACGSASPLAPSGASAIGPEPFRLTGEGAALVELPAGVTRVHITASTKDNSCHHFLVYVAQRLVVNAILGTCSAATARTYDGTHAVLGTLVDIRGSGNSLVPDHNITPLTWSIEGT